MNKLTTHDWLRLQMPEIVAKVHKNLLVELDNGFGIYASEIVSTSHKDKPELLALELIKYLDHQISHKLNRIDSLSAKVKQFEAEFHSQLTDADKHQILLRIANNLEYSKAAIRNISRDKAPWIDVGAINDRFVFIVSRLENEVAFCIERISTILTQLLSDKSQEAQIQLLKQVNIEAILEVPIRYAANTHILLAALKCLRKSLVGLTTKKDTVLTSQLVQYIYRVALDHDIDFWVRSEAIAFIAVIDKEQFKFVVDKVITKEQSKNIYFVSRIIRYICQYHADSLFLQDKLKVMLSFESAYVLQTIAEHCVLLNAHLALELIDYLLKNGADKVRGQCYLSLISIYKNDQIDSPRLLDYLLNRLKHETSVNALRLLLETLPEHLENHINKQHATESFINSIGQQLTQLNLTHQRTAVRRWSAEMREALWSLQYAIKNSQTLSRLPKDSIFELKFSETLKLSASGIPQTESFFRFLAQVGHKRLGFDIQTDKKKLSFVSGFKFKFRSWRFLHEFRHSATDKRQNHNHMKGRVYRGLIQTATTKMSEMSATKVPGEPLYNSEEQGFRGYLPLLDQVLSSLDQGWPTQPMQIYSSEGITEITPPKKLASRLKARILIQTRFAELANLRNWSENDKHKANDYLTALQLLGFTISIKGHTDLVGKRYIVEDKVQRHFPAFTLPFTLPSFSEMQNYFYSVYQNTIQQLLGFTLFALVGFVFLQCRAILSLKKARNNIPLVIGGWGTRGKSGTERLKAALFNALGLSVFSKTTGCEAMFLHGPANRPMKELFLFRPYDKATIWEQVFLTKLASKLKVDVFLWECMGLTPRYIDILQNQWMRDDICTITNCYPDHEDLQGPAGIEIPIVMKRFVPHKSHLITTEDSMFPLLQDATNEKQSQLSTVDWKDAWLITQDVISRFPYEEHPNNIALVTRLAHELGIPKDFALHAMADKVIPDLGVLKIYPRVKIKHRSIEFINGMSANERLATLENWKRTHMDQHSLNETPEIWTCVVINNRADRVARSQVFASILVNDLKADSYILIGNNLAGFEQYIEAAWSVYSEKLNFISLDVEQKERLVQLLVTESERLRIPVSLAQLVNRLRCSLIGLGLADSQAEDIIATIPTEINMINQATFKFSLPEQFSSLEHSIKHQFLQNVQELNQLNNFIERLRSKSINEKLQQQIIDWLFHCFHARFTIINDYYATGNQVIHQIVEVTPPGLQCRMMGMQNIKGTGLDFIYRWQAWNRVHELCTDLTSNIKDYEIEQALKALCSWEEFGILDNEHVIDSIKIARSRNELQKNTLQANLEIALKRLLHQHSLVESSFSENKHSSGTLLKIIEAIEALYDSGQAIKRRRQSDRIYQALVENMISYDKAAIELAKLTKAQKGGWLLERLKRRFNI